MSIGQGHVPWLVSSVDGRQWGEATMYEDAHLEAEYESANGADVDLEDECDEIDDDWRDDADNWW